MTDIGREGPAAGCPDAVCTYHGPAAADGDLDQAIASWDVTLDVVGALPDDDLITVGVDVTQIVLGIIVADKNLGAGRNIGHATEISGVRIAIGDDILIHPIHFHPDQAVGRGTRDGIRRHIHDRRQRVDGQ